ncbi:MAG: hypothetical protein V4608_15705 [Bacteroidota bacterium]
MSSFREKSQVFIMGLMVGLIVAGGFFILKLDDYFKELNFYKNVVKTFQSQSQETVAKTEEPLPSKETTTKELPSRNKLQISDSSNTDKKNFALDSVAINSAALKDTAELNIATASASEDIVVRKDEVLFTKTLEIINLNTPVTTSNTKDSLLHKVSGIKDDKNSAKQFINVELWQSPLNYKGYKMGKYKIILYGIATVEGLKTYSFEDDIYLKHGTIVYRLENTAEFKPYERITDESIVSKLK